MKINGNPKCEFSDLNKECLKEKCPYYPKKSSIRSTVKE
jgi:hypothetical protein